jgi:hypothetical protein
LECTSKTRRKFLVSLPVFGASAILPVAIPAETEEAQKADGIHDLDYRETEHVTTYYRLARN